MGVRDGYPHVNISPTPLPTLPEPIRGKWTLCLPLPAPSFLLVSFALGSEAPPSPKSQSATILSFVSFSAHPIR